MDEAEEMGFDVFAPFSDSRQEVESEVKEKEQCAFMGFLVTASRKWETKRRRKERTC